MVANSWHDIAEWQCILLAIHIYMGRQFLAQNNFDSYGHGCPTHWLQASLVYSPVRRLMPLVSFWTNTAVANVRHNRPLKTLHGTAILATYLGSLLLSRTLRELLGFFRFRTNMKQKSQRTTTHASIMHNSLAVISQNDSRSTQDSVKMLSLKQDCNQDRCKHFAKDSPETPCLHRDHMMSKKEVVKNGKSMSEVF